MFIFVEKNAFLSTITSWDNISVRKLLLPSKLKLAILLILVIFTFVSFEQLANARSSIIVPIIVPKLLSVNFLKYLLLILF